MQFTNLLVVHYISFSLRLKEKERFYVKTLHTTD